LRVKPEGNLKTVTKKDAPNLVFNYLVVFIGGLHVNNFSIELCQMSDKCRLSQALRPNVTGKNE